MWCKQKGLCNLSGKRLSIVRFSPEIVSIDRLDNTKGYVKDNIQLLCSSVNLAKNALDEDYFINMCKAIAERNK